MAVQTTSILSNSHRAQYTAKYLHAARTRRLYDQLASPVDSSKALLQKGSSVVIPFLSVMQKGTSAISETVDITPQTLRDATVSITPTSRAEAIQDSELQVLQNYLDYVPSRYEAIGEGLMETVEDVCWETIVQGGLVKRAAARASLDAGTSGNTLVEKNFDIAANRFLDNRVPGFENPYPGGWSGATYLAIMHPDAYYDLKAGGNIVAAAQYQNLNIVLKNEVGMVGPFRIIASPYAHVFGAAGADNATAIATTISGAENKLEKEIVVASGTSIAVGMSLTIGTEETSTLTDAGTWYPHNERVTVTSVSGTTIGVAGGGPNGGLRYDHAAGEAVRNADSVFPVIFGGPKSLAKLYAVDIGEYGDIVGPLRQGLAQQFISLAYKWYGGYGRPSESWLMRAEVSSAIDA